MDEHDDQILWEEEQRLWGPSDFHTTYFETRVEGMNMGVGYAKSYIDRVYEKRDLGELYSIIGAVSKDRALPEQFGLFELLHEWTALSFRSGVWQHYEARSEGEIEKTAQVLERFGLRNVAEKYRSGIGNWQEPRSCKELDDWIVENELELDRIAFELIAEHRACIYPAP